MGDDPHKPAQRQIRHRHRSDTAKLSLQPFTDFSMPFRILSVDADQDVHVEQDHSPSIRSVRDPDDAKSTPGWIPVPRNVINCFTGAPLVDIDRDSPAKTSRSDSATNSLSEHPRWSAASRACLNRPSGTFTVVLIHHDAVMVHHDVNRWVGA